MLVAALNNAASPLARTNSMVLVDSVAGTPSSAIAPMPAIDAAKYPELATLLANNTKGSDPLGLRSAVATALSQQQGAGDIYAAQLEQAAGIINGFTSTPLQFGTLGSVRNYITRVVQVNTLLGAIQSYLTPTSQLAAQRLLFYGIRLGIEFVTTFPVAYLVYQSRIFVAYLVYQSRIFVAAGDSVGIARDSVGVAIAITNMIVQVSD